MRTIGGALWMSPITRATADSVRMAGGGTLSLQAAGFSTMPSKPRMRKCPQRVGKSASAAFVTLAKGMISLYVSLLMQIGFTRGWVRCRRPRIGADRHGWRTRTDKDKRIERRADQGRKGRIGVKCPDPCLSTRSLVGL